MIGNDEDWSDVVADSWIHVCDFIEEKGGPAGKFISEKLLRKLSIEAPVAVGFCFACVFVHMLDGTIFPGLSVWMGVDDFFDLSNYMMYPRFITHILAHSSYDHIKGNMVTLLLVGPSCEHVFGSKNLIKIMVLVAITSAVAHIWFGRSASRQLGASGVCFALILLNSLVSAKTGKIPVSFVLTAGLWISEELYKFFFSGDGVSHHAHLTGAFVGTAAGYHIIQQKELENLKRLMANTSWFARLKNKKD